MVSPFSDQFISGQCVSDQKGQNSFGQKCTKSIFLTKTLGRKRLGAKGTITKNEFLTKIH